MVPYKRYYVYHKHLDQTKIKLPNHNSFINGVESLHIVGTYERGDVEEEGEVYEVVNIKTLKQVSESTNGFVHGLEYTWEVYYLLYVQFSRLHIRVVTLMGMGMG